MTKNTYGRNIELSVYGGSHDEEIGMHLAGFPADFTVDMDALCAFLARRAPGNNPYGTARTERDQPLFLAGLDKFNRTTGAEIHAAIYNFNAHSTDYDFVYDTPRPGHADYAALQKYGKNVDLRGGGHFSGRLTAPLCIAGGLALQYLAARGIRVQTHIAAIGGIEDAEINTVTPDIAALDAISALPLPTLDREAGAKMATAIQAARADGDSLGGIVECIVTGLPAGLGTHMFDGAEGRIAALLYAIPAVKGVEFGAGFAAAAMKGSTHNDAYTTDGTSIWTLTNNAGGILGGMTTGAPLVCRAAFKPTPSIAKSQQTVSLSRMENTTLSVGGRHDPCIVPRALPVVEAAVALALLDMLLDEETR
ncbi:MAG: chorismate synthase [Clostridia bacterium]|nr:chorismate synthase [Clostridia bacterium]